MLLWKHSLPCTLLLAASVAACDRGADASSPLGTGALALESNTSAPDGENAAAREQANVARASLATIVSAQDGRYRAARSLAVEGQTSVSARSQAWLSHMQTWTESWAKVLAFADLKDDAPYDVFLAKLTAMLAEQNGALVALQDEAVTVRRAATATAALLGRSETIPTGPEAAEFADIIGNLQARQTDVRAMIEAVASVPESKLARLADIDDLSRRAILAHVKAALLERARFPLDKALADIQSLLAAEKVIDPALTRIQAAFTRMNGYRSSLAFYHAKAEAASAKSQCDAARTAFNILSGPPAMVTGAKAKLENMCTGIERLAGGFTTTDGVVAADYVSGYLDGQKTQLKTLCTTPAARIPCERLALLASMTEDDLHKMPDGQLRQVEMGWGDSLDQALGK